LFGQPELNAKLDQPNMRQLKDRIVHHFHMQPLSRNSLESYLMFRMRAAGYHGPNIFSSKAIKLIAGASNGLMRRVNVLADKSLLAAFVEDTHDVEVRHVKAAMRDSEINTAPTLSGKQLLLGSAAAALFLFGLLIWWMQDKPHTSLQQVQEKPPTLAAVPEAAVKATQPIAAQPNKVLSPAVKTQTSSSSTNTRSPTPKIPSLYEQRLTAGKQLIKQKNAVASIQLFYKEEVRPERIEGFLKRANALGKLSEIYLLPAKFGGKDGLRVLYGAYPSIDAAHEAIKDLPARYQEAFATSTYIF
jgi:MSHA biogenesis protein MshM